HPRGAKLVEPTGLDRVHAPGSVTGQEPLDVRVARRLARPERAAGTVAREPVRGYVVVVARPDERIRRIVPCIRARLEPLDGAVLAAVPQGLHRAPSLPGRRDMSGPRHREETHTKVSRQCASPVLERRAEPTGPVPGTVTRYAQMCDGFVTRLAPIS